MVSEQQGGEGELSKAVSYVFREFARCVSPCLAQTISDIP